MHLLLQFRISLITFPMILARQNTVLRHNVVQRRVLSEFKKNSKNNVNTDTSLDKYEMNFLEKTFPDYFSNGKFVTRITYNDFIEMAMEKMDELGANKNPQVYKELMKIFPPGKYHPRSIYSTLGMFHPAQQVCALRLLEKMMLNGIRPDKEMEIIVTNAFSKYSTVWLKLARSTYWTMKGRNIDQYALPDKIPEQTHEVALLALKRMSVADLNTRITVLNTARLPDIVDKTWVVSSQSPLQQSQIEKLDEKSVLHVEEGGLLYVGDKYVTYYLLKVYTDNPKKDDNPTLPDLTHNYNKLKFQFYGKPLQDKLYDMETIHQIGNYHILGAAITGTSSHDSLLSWVKFLQESNPKLDKLSILFDINRPTNEVVQAKPEAHSR